MFIHPLMKQSYCQWYAMVGTAYDAQDLGDGSLLPRATFEVWTPDSKSQILNFKFGEGSCTLRSACLNRIGFVDAIHE